MTRGLRLFMTALPLRLSAAFDWAGQTKPLHPGPERLALRRTLAPFGAADPSKP